MSGQDVDNMEEYQIVFEEVGEVVNTPDVVEDVPKHEDINLPHCDSEYKKYTNHHWLIFSKEGKKNW